MITAYTAKRKKFKKEEVVNAIILSDALWIDLYYPTKDEETMVEKAFSLDVPTQGEMHKIEISNRLYQESKDLFMTATILSQTNTEMPEALPITFILTGQTLITVRYNDPKSFQIFPIKAQNSTEEYDSGQIILIGLIDTIIDRLAQILEVISNDIDVISHTLFSKDTSQPDYYEILRQIGKNGDLNSKARESLVTINRLVAFLTHHFDPSLTIGRKLKSQVKTMSQNVNSLSDHSSFISSKVNFLLDATLGMLNIEQNTTIKIFSVAAVVFLPPTLVASIYGMNFEFIPELKLHFGYFLALMFMILSAIVPYWIFKRRGWL